MVYGIVLGSPKTQSWGAAEFIFLLNKFARTVLTTAIKLNVLCTFYCTCCTITLIYWEYGIFTGKRKCKFNFVIIDFYQFNC